MNQQDQFLQYERQSQDRQQKDRNLCRPVTIADDDYTVTRPYYDQKLATQMNQQNIPQAIVENFDPHDIFQQQSQPTNWNSILRMLLIVIIIIAFIVLLSRLFSGIDWGFYNDPNIFIGKIVE